VKAWTRTAAQGNIDAEGIGITPNEARNQTPNRKNWARLPNFVEGRKHLNETRTNTEAKNINILGCRYKYLQSLE
jgi:hypothetical protein